MAQEKSKIFSKFSERTEVLARKLGIGISDLPDRIKVSASMFHSYRSGKYPISAKAWRKLEAAETAAGLGPLHNDSATRLGDVDDFRERESVPCEEFNATDMAIRLAEVEAELAKQRDVLGRVLFELATIRNGAGQIMVEPREKIR